MNYRKLVFIEFLREFRDTLNHKFLKGDIKKVHKECNRSIFYNLFANKVTENKN